MKTNSKMCPKITTTKGIIFLFIEGFIIFSIYYKINFHKDSVLEYKERKTFTLELSKISSQQLEKSETLLNKRTDEVFVNCLNHIKCLRNT